MIIIACGIKPKITQEIFEERLHRFHPDYIVLGKYINSETKVRVKCSCGHEFESDPSHLMHGSGCPKCSRKWNIHNQEEFENVVNHYHPNYEILSSYTTRIGKVLCRCKDCGYEWEDTAASLVSWKKHCPNCFKPSFVVSEEEFLRKLHEVSPNIKLAGEFTKMHDSTWFKCVDCGHKWKTSPSHLIKHKNSGCPKCNSKEANEKRKKTTEQFIDDLEYIGSDIKVIGEYKYALEPIECLCPKCGNSFMAYPSNLLKGQSGCKECSNKELNDKKRWTEDEWLDNLYARRLDVVPLEPYVNAGTPILFKCTKCGGEFMTPPRNILKGMLCSICDDCVTTNGEKIVEDVLNDLGVRYQEQKRFPGLRHKHRLRFDFYLPEYNACLEYDGLQHFEPVDIFGGAEHYNSCIDRDAKKANFCLDNGITLHRIMYTNNTYKGVRKNIVDFLEKYYGVQKFSHERDAYAT